MSRIGKITLIAFAGLILTGLPVLGEDSPATQGPQCGIRARGNQSNG